MIGKIVGSKGALIGVLVVVTLAVYLNTLANDFVYDDNFHILNNPWITDLNYLIRPFYSSVWEFHETISEGMNNYYRPVMHLIFTLEYHVFGFEPWGWHLFNVLFHAMNSVLVFIIIKGLLEGERGLDGGEERKKVSATTIAFMAALLFAVHPVSTEVVAWVSAMTELSFALFYLLAFHLYMRHRATGRKVYLALSVASFFLSTLCKETSVTLPVLLVCYDLIRKRSMRVKDMARYVPYAVAGLVYIGLRVNALHGMVPRGRMHPYLDTFQYVINAFPLFVKYLKTLILPVKLTQFHIFNPVYSITELYAFGALIITAVVLFLFWRLGRVSRLFLVGFLIMTVPLLPVFYIPGLARNTFAERYLYVPSAGFAFLLALGVRELIERTGAARSVVRAVTAAFIILIASCSYGTVKRNTEWKDEFTLWYTITEKYPDHYYALSEAGTILNRTGRRTEAISLLEKSVSLNAARRNPEPMTLAHARHELGDAYFALGMKDRAAREYFEALRLYPDRFGANYNLALIFQEKGRYEEAIALYTRALESAGNPVDIKDCRLNIGNIHARMGRWSLAVESYRLALEAVPNDPTVRNNLSIVEKRMGDASPGLDPGTGAP